MGVELLVAFEWQFLKLAKLPPHWVTERQDTVLSCSRCHRAAEGGMAQAQPLPHTVNGSSFPEGSQGKELEWEGTAVRMKAALRVFGEGGRGSLNPEAFCQTPPPCFCEKGSLRTSPLLPSSLCLREHCPCKGQHFSPL